MRGGQDDYRRYPSNNSPIYRGIKPGGIINIDRKKAAAIKSKTECF